MKMKSHFDIFQVVREQSGKGQLDTDKSAQNSQSVTLELYDTIELEIEKVIIEDLLKPLLFVIKYTLPFHNTIKYDPVERCCVHVKGSFWRKICCVVWELLILFRLGLMSFPNVTSDEFLSSPEEDRAGISVIAQMANVMFIVFGLYSFYIFWSKTKCMCDVLNSALQLTNKIHLDEASPSRSNLMKYVTHASWIFVVCFVIWTFVMHTFQAFFSSSNLADLSTRPKGDRGRYRLDFTGYHFTNESAYFKVLVIVANCMNIVWWMMTNFFFSTWGFFFRQLVKLFYWRIDEKHALGHCIVIPQEIRTFNEISTVIDKFNQIFGIQVLFSAVIIVCYLSLSIKYVFIGMDHLLEMSSGLHLFLSYIPMAVGSSMLAEVPRVAGMFAVIIKSEFGTCTKESGDAAESMCGISIVHYDLITSNVGVKGLGFFSVSYQFITTTVGVIISYSILMAQLFPKENGTVVA